MRFKVGEKQRDEEQVSHKNARKVSDKIRICPQFDALCPFTLYLHWCQLDGGDV